MRVWTSLGFCFYKATNGIKRHLAVDTLGFPFFTHCTKANVSDDAGLLEMLTHNIDYFRSKPMNIPKITILQGSRLSPRASDAGARVGVSANYEKDQFWIIHQAIQTTEGSDRKVWICASHCSMGDASAPMLGLVRCKILVKNYERTLANATTKLNLCFVRLMIKRLAAF